MVKSLAVVKYMLNQKPGERRFVVAVRNSLSLIPEAYWMFKKYFFREATKIKISFLWHEETRAL